MSTSSPPRHEGLFCPRSTVPTRPPDVGDPTGTSGPRGLPRDRLAVICHGDGGKTSQEPRRRARSARLWWRVEAVCAATPDNQTPPTLTGREPDLEEPTSDGHGCTYSPIGSCLGACSRCRFGPCARQERPGRGIVHTASTRASSMPLCASPPTSRSLVWSTAPTRRRHLARRRALAARRHREQLHRPERGNGGCWRGSRRDRGVDRLSPPPDGSSQLI